MIGILTGIILSGMVTAQELSIEKVKEIEFFVDRVNLVDEYKKKIIGRRIDYDKNGSYQCVDLAKDRYTKVTKTISPAFKGSAYKAWKYGVQGLVRTEAPIPGDLVFLKFSNREAGHVGVFLFVEGNYVWLIDQNGGSGSGTGKKGDQARIAKFHKSLVLGYKTFNNKSE